MFCVFLFLDAFAQAVLLTWNNFTSLHLEESHTPFSVPLMALSVNVSIISSDIDDTNAIRMNLSFL